MLQVSSIVLEIHILEGGNSFTKSSTVVISYMRWGGSALAPEEDGASHETSGSQAAVVSHLHAAAHPRLQEVALFVAAPHGPLSLPGRVQCAPEDWRAPSPQIAVPVENR